MIVLDPGHIYQIKPPGHFTTTEFRFVKRSGGAVTYTKEWPGIQTQAVMRAVIDYLTRFERIKDIIPVDYPLWQLGLNSTQTIVLYSLEQLDGVIEVLIDRSIYLNNILSCVETLDSITWFETALETLSDVDESNWLEKSQEAAQCVRLALWNYEARAYRRKQEEVNRKQPTHDDTVSPKPWRDLPASDVPFNEEDIELRPIGLDGHIVLERQKGKFPCLPI